MCLGLLGRLAHDRFRLSPVATIKVGLFVEQQRTIDAALNVTA